MRLRRISPVVASLMVMLRPWMRAVTGFPLWERPMPME